MKLKCTPQDFQVEELTSVKPSARGRYNFYCLTKCGLGTIEAIEAICRRWNLSSHRVSYGGLKDRHAETIQYLTIQEGPARASRDQLRARADRTVAASLWSAAFPGQPVPRRGAPPGPGLRLLAVGRLQAVCSDGLPNYFDDQRSRSVGFSGEFIGQAWLKGEHERALWLAIAEPNPFDRSGDKTQKAILRECWGRWGEAKATLERSSTRSIVTYLVDHPTDYRGAFARLKRAAALARFLGVPEPPLEPPGCHAGSRATPSPTRG